MATNNPRATETSECKSDSPSELSAHLSISSGSSPFGDVTTAQKYTSAAWSDNSSAYDASSTDADVYDGQPSPSASTFFDSSCDIDRIVRNKTAVKPVTDADAMCKWDMSLFNFPLAIRNETVGCFPWVGNSSLPWKVVLRILDTRYPAKPFYPKDPRVSKSIWAVSVVQKNRASCNKIILNVAALYVRAQREAIHQRSGFETDELIDLMNNISVRDTDKTAKFPWITKIDPTWGGILMALDILFATNPSSNIDDAELRMNYMRAPRFFTPSHPFSTLRVAFSPPSVRSIKRKQEAISENRDDQDHGADADIEDADDDDDEDTDDEDAAPYNQRLKRARID